MFLLFLCWWCAWKPPWNKFRKLQKQKGETKRFRGCKIIALRKIAFCAFRSASSLFLLVFFSFSFFTTTAPLRDYADVRRDSSPKRPNRYKMWAEGADTHKKKTKATTKRDEEAAAASHQNVQERRQPAIIASKEQSARTKSIHHLH